MGSKRALAIVFGLVTPLFGCGAVDSGVTFLPESFRQPAPKVEIEQPPDVHLIVRSKSLAVSLIDPSPLSRHRLHDWTSVNGLGESERKMMNRPRIGTLH